MIGFTFCAAILGVLMEKLAKSVQIKSMTAKKISKLLILEPFLVNWYDLDIIKVRFLNSWVIITLVYYTRGENQLQYRK